MLLLRGGPYIVSILIVVLFLALDTLPLYAVAYAMAVPALFILVVKLAQQRARPLRALGDWAMSLVRALAIGVVGALPVIAVCAAAGVVTSTIAKTGLGRVLASTLTGATHALGDNQTVVLILTAVFCALATLLLGLAIPVVASFIIAWVGLAPVLQGVGVQPHEAAMFLFYYAVLSEVTPPTALAPLAAAAVTGGSANRTTVQTWKYTLPAFLVPFAFVLTDNGSALLGERSLVDVLWVAAMSALGVAAIAVAATGWMLGPARWPERTLCAAAALLLLYLEPWVIAAGVGLMVAAVALHKFTSVVPVSESAGP